MSPLDPEAQVVIDGIRRAGTPPLSSLALSEARRMYAKGLRMLDIAPDKTIATTDRDLVAPGFRIPVRVYRRPDDADLAGRVLLWFHGGGYCVGDIETTDIVCRMFTAVCGCNVVSVNYRLAPEHPFPAAVDDAFGAYRALLDASGGDADRIVVSGESAGATLALVTSLLARDHAVPTPAAQLLIGPTALGRRDTESKRRFGEGLFLSAKDLEWFYDQYTGGRDLDNDFRFAPIAAANLGNLPRTLIVAAGCDPLHDDAVALASALSSAAVDVQLDEHAGLTHSFFHMGGFVSRARAAHQEACAFLDHAWRTVSTVRKQASSAIERDR